MKLTAALLREQFGDAKFTVDDVQAVFENRVKPEIACRASRKVNAYRDGEETKTSGHAIKRGSVHEVRSGVRAIARKILHAEKRMGRADNKGSGKNTVWWFLPVGEAEPEPEQKPRKKKPNR